MSINFFHDREIHSVMQLRAVFRAAPSHFLETIQALDAPGMITALKEQNGDRHPAISASRKGHFPCFPNHLQKTVYLVV